ncbi:MAG: hypothetical protein C0591_00655 [Marinilabiliales bacterium]|nr:MAG: hypothetical protein C0591_00655 [Marinilabiliales bacterium]
MIEYMNRKVLKNILLFLFVMIFSINANALSEEEYFHLRDSLQQQVNITAGHERVDALFNLVRHIVAYEQDTAEALIREEFELAENLGYTNGLAQAYQNKGSLFYQRDDFAKAFENFQQASTLFEEAGNYIEAGTSLFYIVPIYSFTGNNALNRELFLRIMTFYKKAANKANLGMLYHWMAYHYNNFDNNPELAKQSIQKALQMDQGNTPTIVISGWYGSLALAYSKSGQFDSSLIALNQANNYLKGKTYDDEVTRLINERDLGNVLTHLGKTDSAIYYIEKSRRKADSLSYLYGVAICCFSLGQINMGNHNYEDAIANFSIAFNKADEINRTGNFFSNNDKKYTTEWIGDAWPGYPKYVTRGGKKYWAKILLKNTSYYLSESYRLYGDADMAFQYYRAYHAWSDSLKAIERIRDLLGLQIAYETRLKDRKIDTLSQANKLKEIRLRQSIYLIIGLGAFILLSISYMLLFNRQRKLREEQEKGLLKQKLFQLQLNPHFIFNSLSSIQHLVVEEDTEKASIYLARFSNLIRNILYSSSDDAITLENEIKNIENYLTLQKLRYNKKFDYTIDADPALEIENIEIPVMLAQPFIENAIEHGVKHKGSKGHIRVGFKLHDNLLEFEVEDDGIGRQKAQEILQQQNKDHRSMATAITLERIQVLNRKRKKKIRLEIVDLVDANGIPLGTKVRFEIPLT